MFQDPKPCWKYAEPQLAIIFPSEGNKLPNFCIQDFQNNTFAMDIFCKVVQLI